MRKLALLMLLPLAACATPRQSCERAALYDLRVLDTLIRESEQTIARGYGYRREPYERTRFDFCYGSRFGRSPAMGFTFCDYPDVGIREVPVTVDLAAERRNLAELKAKRTEAARRAARALSACEARYPGDEKG
ncbi:hypothetical protein DSD19_20695 [Rhodovulum sp. BSW8]|uniref:Excinuclease ABC subunit B n=1 Tax=Rhodovulum visakhapatnamense TaxID=364297 RepID=A0A4R8FM62_9RHOB|nr:MULTISPECIES: hypothetical protein [Rhodovulum]OLS43563.1 hypothetical protein BV509_03970 [Rhodovulum sulfidophilum]MBL3569012.1 hypothetical protein [Rhodovulum visakhapatnamense]MBL3579614.1 hypothetical protein [Rhodovulum visakhapatnamense]RBO51247.1 hypothetical protein DSD19_20695 [Rhodovulum sp. BSW8]TDX24835.1 hypothetical protein EV657_12110 [Rhodovulum visakhapatnamense]